MDFVLTLISSITRPQLSGHVRPIGDSRIGIARRGGVLAKTNTAARPVAHAPGRCGTLSCRVIPASGVAHPTGQGPAPSWGVCHGPRGTLSCRVIPASGVAPGDGRPRLGPVVE